MALSRRGFLKAGTVGGTSLWASISREARAEMREFKISRTTETRSICPYCAVSCGVIIHTLGDRAKNATASVVHVEGDPDHPINRGTLCPKGATLKDDINNPNRLTKPQVRRPGSDHWEDISWDEAIAGIARHIKETRDAVLRREERQGPGRQPQPRHGDDRRLHRHERVQLPALEVHHRPGECRTGTPRPGFDTAPRWPVWPPRSGAGR